MSAVLEWAQLLARPTARFALMLSLGLLVATLVEALRLARPLSALFAPLTRFARLGEDAAASFSLAFFSAMSANALLADAWRERRLSRRELVTASLLNSFPAFVLHLPGIFFMAVSTLGLSVAGPYAALISGAALARTLAAAALGRAVLPPLAGRKQAGGSEGSGAAHLPADGPPDWRRALARGGRLFARRLPRFLFWGLPVYCLTLWAARMGHFQALEAWLGRHGAWLPFLKPQAAGVVALHMGAEFGAALSAAASLLESGALTGPDIVLALLAGNILSSPARAARHQFPAYAGYYRPGLALLLIGAGQAMRAASLVLAGAVFACWP